LQKFPQGVRSGGAVELPFTNQFLGHSDLNRLFRQGRFLVANELALVLGARWLGRGWKRMRPVQIPLLQDTHQAAGQNIQRQAARKGKTTNITEKVSGMIFIICACCGSVVVIGVIFDTRYIVMPTSTGRT